MPEDKELKQLRDDIDDADRALVEALARRMKLVEEVGAYKRKNDLHVYDAARHQEILATRVEWGRNHSLAGNLVRDLFEAILKYAKELQK